MPVSKAVLLISIVLVAGVVTADDRPPGTVELLLGTWEWDRAVGGFAGGEYGPADWGFTSQLLFLADGTVIEYRDEVAYAQSVFTVIGDGPGATVEADPSTPSVMPFGDCGPYLVTFGEEGGVQTMMLQTQLCADWYDFLYTERGTVPNETGTWSSLKSLFR